MVQRIRVIDSHTEGEPTRVVVQGAPELPGRTVAERAHALSTQFDWVRRGVVLEPRGSDVLVGALLVPPDSPDSTAGVIFFNNAGVLGMCGHGTIGVVRTLMHMTRVQPGAMMFDTPVGQVRAQASAMRIEVSNVRSYAAKLDVEVRVDGRPVRGDLAWGGNAFFLTESPGITLEMKNIGALSQFTLRVRDALCAAGLGELGGRAVDHIEVFGPPQDSSNDSRNFVMCPGGAYDRSPCGTGTSAKLACLAARGQLQPGERWRQESIIGTVFEAWYQAAAEGGVLPTISGRAWITAEAELLFEDGDPTHAAR